jgi:hypothetical protein
MMPGASEAALDALKGLISTGGWRRCATHPSALHFVRHWPLGGEMDALLIQGEDSATGERTNSDDMPVWRRRGSLVEVVAALRGLPDPGTAGAPTEVLRQPGGE